MSQNLIKAISLDWEGCVSQPGGGRAPWPTSLIAQLGNCLGLFWNIRGVDFFLNTGRQAPYVEAGLQALGIITKTPSLFENGTGLYFPATKGFKFNPAITPEKLALFQDVRKKLVRIVDETIETTRELGRECSFSSNPPAGMAIEEYFNTLQLEISYENSEIQRIIEMTHSQTAVDVTIRGVNKETGLEFWCQETRFSLNELAGIGDSRGDRPVLENVALPMCPANTTEDIKSLVKKRGGYISNFPTTLGVIDCLSFLSEDSFMKDFCQKIIHKWQLEFTNYLHLARR